MLKNVARHSLSWWAVSSSLILPLYNTIFFASPCPSEHLGRTSSGIGSNSYQACKILEWILFWIDTEYSGKRRECSCFPFLSALNALSVIWIPDLSFRLNSDQCVSLTVYWRISNCMGAVWRIWVQSWASKLNFLCKGHQMFTYRRVNRVLKTWILCFTGQWNTPVKLWASTIWYNALTLNIKCAFLPWHSTSSVA